MNTKIKRTSSEGLAVKYDSTLSPSSHIAIYWDTTLGGGVGMSVEQARELQGLLTEVLALATRPPIQTVFTVQGMQWPQTLGDFTLMGPANRRGKWRWYRRNIIANGALVAERIKVNSNLQPVWESLTRA